MARPRDVDLKRNLLRAAAHEFATAGLGAKIESISTRAGYSKAAFYLHFDSKEAAFRELVTTFIDGFESLIHDGELLTDVASVTQKQIRVFEYLWNHRVVARLVYEPIATLEYRKLWDDVFERGRQRFERFIVDRIEAGIFDAGLDPALASLLFMGAQERLTRTVLRKTKKPNFEELVTQSHRLLFEGLLAHGATSK